MDVIFFPRNDYPNNIEICNHRLGKKMTYCERTSDIPTVVQNTVLPYVRQKFFSDKIRVGCDFMDVYVNSAWNTEYGKQCIAEGVISPDLYFYPNPYQQDPTNYTKAMVESAWNRLLPWFIEQFGVRPVAADFSSGQGGYYRDYTILRENLLCCDSSSTDLNKTDYGVGVGNPNNVPWSLERYYPRLMNSRVLDYARGHISDYPEEKDAYDYYINQMANLIDTTLALPNGGFIMNFHHWHDLVYMDYNRDGTPKEGRNDYAINNGFKPYIDMLCQKNVNDEIYFAGYGEAISYLVYRQSITKAVMYSPIKEANSKLIIRLEAKNVPTITIYDENNNEQIQPINTDLLQIPISVKFTTVGTPLANQAIKSNNNLISLGNNNYIIEIPWNRYPGAVIEKVNL